VQDGFITIRGHRIHYRIAGTADENGRLPLLVLHGGPGMSWDDLEPLDALAGGGRRVVYYDQLGGGDSDRPHTHHDEPDRYREVVGGFLAEMDRSAAPPGTWPPIHD
jgi:pimeloyl-ACP methyl ester carboxylesterase